VKDEERQEIRAAAEDILRETATESAAKKKLARAQKKPPFKGFRFTSNSVHFNGTGRTATLYVAGEQVPIEVQV